MRGGKRDVKDFINKTKLGAKKLKEKQKEKDENEQAYPEISIPIEFVTNFEREKKLNPGQVWLESREV